MKTVVALLIFSSAMPSYANAQTCTQQIQQKLTQSYNVTKFLGFGGFVYLPMLGGAAAYYGTVAVKRQRILRILNEAANCTGEKINKLYSKYKVGRTWPMDINDFCEKIQKSDLDGSLCANGRVPSRNEIIEHILNKH